MRRQHAAAAGPCQGRGGGGSTGVLLQELRRDAGGSRRRRAAPRRAHSHPAWPLVPVAGLCQRQQGARQRPAAALPHRRRVSASWMHSAGSRCSTGLRGRVPATGGGRWRQAVAAPTRWLAAPLPCLLSPHALPHTPPPRPVCRFRCRRDVSEEQFIKVVLAAPLGGGPSGTARRLQQAADVATAPQQQPAATQAATQQQQQQQQPAAADAAAGAAATAQPQPQQSQQQPPSCFLYVVRTNRACGELPPCAASLDLPPADDYVIYKPPLQRQNCPGSECVFAAA